MSGNEQQDMARINAALRFTGGDMDKARMMAMGELNDLVAVKCRFAVENADTYGSFLLFARPAESFCVNGAAAQFPLRDPYDKILPRDPWKLFLSTLQKLAEPAGGFINDLYQHIVTSLEGYDLYADIEKGDIPQISDMMEDIIRKFYNMANVICDIETEPCSSLNLYDAKIPVAQKGEKSAAEPAKPEDTRPQIEKDAEFVFDAKVIVSPVRGKYINDIQKGEVIKLLPLRNEGIARKVAELQKAVNAEGQITPLKGRLREMIPNEKAGSTIYCTVAKGILARIVEEENVKIEVDVPVSGTADAGAGTSLPLYIALMVALVLIALVLIYVLI